MLQRTSRSSCLIAGLLAGMITGSGCGKAGAPLPPEIRVAERTNDLTAYQEGEAAVLTWSYPSMTTAGDSLTDVEWIVP